MKKTSFRLLLLFCVLTVTKLSRAEVTLPGIDVLSSGFDSASWTSKSRIFNLHDEDGEKVHIASIDKTFIAPADVSVITHGAHSKRVEESCVGVYSHFSQFVHTYKLSVSFDVGIKSDKFSLGISAHYDVKKIYEAITKKGQAIGISESWWGMYEVSLPPPFLMTSKFSPLFKQTVAYLKKIGIPKTEEQQRIYNQVCCGAGGFGTHYVGSIIVGGRAKVTNFVNSSFHKEHSEKTVSYQVSIGFEWKKLNLSSSVQSEDMRKKLMQDFEKNSNQIITYQPDIKEIHNAKAPWLEWEKATIQNPIVVNTSVSSIANLFFDSPDVMKHMQKTIDFYIKWNKQPRLSDIRGLLSNTLLSNSNKFKNVVPGLKIVGCGFDATSLSSKNCLFQQPSSTLPHSTWSNPYYPDIVYNVPFGYFVSNTPESLISDSTVIMKTIDDYVEKSVFYERHHHSGFLGFGSRTETITTRKYYRMFYAHSYQLALSLRQIAWYTLRLLEFPLPMYSKTFKMALDYLPSVYDPSNSTVVSIYKMFFESFGTDVVTGADMGGLVWAENWFESCLSKLYSDTCITDEVRRGWWFVHRHRRTQKCDKRIVNDMKKYSEHHYEMLGGTSGKIKQKDWDEWVLSVKHDPRPVKYTLSPIYYLLPDSHSKKKSLMDATYAYLKNSHDNKQKIIDSLKVLRPPPPSLCKRINEEVAVANTFINMFGNIFSNPLSNFNNNVVSKSHTSRPADALCPIVGYHGDYCPTKYKQNVRNNKYNGGRSLPRGIGITYDVTTGELKLPVLKYEDSSNVWIDPLSNERYIIPKHVSLTIGENVQSENVPIMRIFKTEEQLVSVWETGYKNGTWIGGEFGHRKSIVDLYNKFFSKQEAISINQHPQGLYRLSLTGEWENNLNEFVLKSLRSLPYKYDSNVYNRFMDTWGTHVANDTLVGGLSEQQIIMKNCIWKSPYLSGGLTDTEIENYLKMELGKSTPKNTFYQVRRKMNIDHRIGGNPEISDDKLWMRTLSKNPALIKIYSQVDWATVARKAGINSIIVKNLNRSLRERMTYHEKQRVREKEETKAMKVKYLQGPRAVVAIIANGRRGKSSPWLSPRKVLTLKGFANCHPGLDYSQSKRLCNTDVYITSRNVLRYERNAEGGTRSVSCHDNMSSGRCKTVHGPWVRDGCSLIGSRSGRDPFVSDYNVAPMVCTGCELLTSEFRLNSIVKCVCPGY